MRLDDEAIKNYQHRMDTQYWNAVAVDFIGKLLADRKELLDVIILAKKDLESWHFESGTKECEGCITCEQTLDIISNVLADSMKLPKSR